MEKNSQPIEGMEDLIWFSEKPFRLHVLYGLRAFPPCSPWFAFSGLIIPTSCSWVGGTMRYLRLLLCVVALAAGFASQSLRGQIPAYGTVADEFDRLHFRSIGPVNMSGRIADFAFFEANP